MPEPDQPAIPFTLVEDLLLKEDYLEASDKTAYLKDALKVTLQQISNIAEMTVGQATNPLWCAMRKMRFTASNFGHIITALKSNRCDPGIQFLSCQ